MKGGTMLVLSRKNGERIHIGESVVLTVITSRNGHVRLGLEAPAGTLILREEALRSPTKGGAVPPDSGESRGKEVPRTGTQL
jgi:carbon storage regulator